MLLRDIVAMIPPDALEAIRRESDSLHETYPVNDNGEKIDWFEVLARDWWKKENELPNGWFQWWDD